MEISIVENNVVENKCDFDKDSLIFSCPNCAMMIMVKKNQMNCCIFRHGTFIKRGKIGSQIGRHLSESKCKQLVKQGKIVGCGLPFKLIEKEKIIYAIQCDYN